MNKPSLLKLTALALVQEFANEYSKILADEERSYSYLNSIKKEMHHRAFVEEISVLDRLLSSFKNAIRNSLTGPSNRLKLEGEIASLLILEHLELIDMYVSKTYKAPKSELVPFTKINYTTIPNLTHV